MFYLMRESGACSVWSFVVVLAGQTAADDVQVGTVSFGVGCGAGIAGVYEAVQVASLQAKRYDDPSLPLLPTKLLLHRLLHCMQLLKVRSRFTL